MNATQTVAWTSSRQSQLQIGLWIFLGTATMLFGAFGSAYIVRRATGAWTQVELPALLWVNTAVLLASSIALEVARARARARLWIGARRATVLAVSLGLAFLAGQFAVWRDLVARHVYVSSGAHGAFFYLLTGVHAVHLSAGLIFMAVVAARLGPRAAQGLSPSAEHLDGPRLGLLRLCATFWHYFAAVWLYLFAMLALF